MSAAVPLAVSRSIVEDTAVYFSFFAASVDVTVLREPS